MSPEDAKLLAFNYMTSTPKTAGAVYEEALGVLGHKRKHPRRRIIWSDVLCTVEAAIQLNTQYADEVRRVWFGHR
ncbi:hypothetical protein [Azospirillum brasilense]|uniref:Uncharacterized protein n=1 Tax=Azospirillum brasilense TaxID=192 RepID=A0A235H682_AZOBR|nr:hypothetical protein [Azospirillum brasilense]OYD80964.1 hypothetical protein CHT98_28625 [Azospirillum brasilense]